MMYCPRWSRQPICKSLTTVGRIGDQATPGLESTICKNAWPLHHLRRLHKLSCPCEIISRMYFGVSWRIEYYFPSYGQITIINFLLCFYFAAKLYKNNKSFKMQKYPISPSHASGILVKKRKLKIFHVKKAILIFCIPCKLKRLLPS